MGQLSITILGLGRFGASIGLALKRYMANAGKHQFEIVGYDSRPEFEKAAVQLKAVDHIESRAINAVKNKDIVVIALPYDEVRGAYQYVSEDLRDGVVILDASPIKRPSLEWARKYLTDEHHVIGFTPIVNAKYLFESAEHTESASADLFDDSAMMLTPSVSSIKEAIDLAFNFATIIGARPNFMDPDEHDALVTYTEIIPALLGTATFYAAVKNEGWNDMQKLGNPAFGALTHHLYDTHPDALRDMVLENREGLVRHLDEVITTIQSLRNLIQSNNRDSIEAVMVKAADDYQVWYNKRFKAEWDNIDRPPIEAPTMMSSLLGNQFAKRLWGDKKE